MQAAIIHRWGSTVPGREQHAMALMAETNALCEKWVSEGRLTDFAWYFPINTTGGLMITRGEAAALTSLTADEEYAALVTKVGLANQDYSWGIYGTGDSIPGAAATWMAALEQVTS